MSIIVNVENFARAESDRMFAGLAVGAPGANGWVHYREPAPLDRQTVIRTNRDTLYSVAVVDAMGGFSLTLPDAGERYMSAMVINQDHYLAAVWHGVGPHTMTREEAGTDHVIIGVRTLVDPVDPADIAIVNTLQSAIAVDAASATPFVSPDYDAASLTKVRDALLALASGLSDYRGAFGTRDEVDPIRHVIGTASGWGGLPESEALYLNTTPDLPVGDFEITLRDVPADAFWSVSVYNRDGYFEPNDRGINNINSVIAVPNDDGSVTVRFGDGDAANTIPITEGWNYLLRLYRPRAAAFDGSWSAPVPAPIE